jgi:hypothetical protein
MYKEMLGCSLVSGTVVQGQAAGMARVVVCLPRMYRGLGSSPAPKREREKGTHPAVNQTLNWTSPAMFIQQMTLVQWKLISTKIKGHVQADKRVEAKIWTEIP